MKLTWDSLEEETYKHEQGRKDPPEGLATKDSSNQEIKGKGKTNKKLDIWEETTETESPQFVQIENS